MAVTTTEQTAILELVVLMFDAAPGSVYLPLINSVYEQGGRSLPALATALGNTAIYRSLHPGGETADAFATSFLTPLGLQDDATARTFIVDRLAQGASKAQVSFEAYAVLHNLAPNLPQIYQDAKAIMENRADVAAHYSITLAQPSTSLGTLQAVLDDVTADPASVAAAIDELDDALAPVTPLTLNQDFVNITTTTAANVTGTVDGDDDGNSSAGTLSAGDSVDGNGNTNLFLTVRETGDAPNAVLKDLESVAITSDVAGRVTMNASGWSAIPVINLSGGTDGAIVALDNLAAGIDLAISGVDGTIEAGYLRGGGVDVVLANNSDFESARFALETNGNIDAGLGDNGTLVITAASSLGNVMVTGDAGSAASLDVAGTAGALTVGTVSIDAGSASLTLVEADALTSGAIRLAGDDAASLLVDGTVNVTLGTVTLSAGNSGEIDANVSTNAPGNLQVGNTSVTGGNFASADLDLAVMGTAAGTAGNLAAGTLTIAMGEGATVDAQLSANAAQAANNLGSFSAGATDVELGSDSEAAFEFEHRIVTTAAGTTVGMGDMTVGAFELTSGDNADVTVRVQQLASLEEPAAFTNGDLVVGDIGIAISATGETALSGGSTLALLVEKESNATSGTGGSLTVGLLSLEAGDTGMFEIDVEYRDFANLGDYSVEGLEVDVGHGSQVTVDFALDKKNVAGSVGNISIGDIGVTAGAGADIDVDLDLFGLHKHAAVGDFTLGDVVLALGADAEADLSGLGFPGAGADVVGDVNVGSVAATLADGAIMSFDPSVVAQSAIGDVTVGAFTLTAGEEAAYTHRARFSAEGSIGNLATGGWDVVAGADSEGTLVFRAEGTLGTVEVGDVELDLAQYAEASAEIFLGGSDTIESAAVGDLTVHVDDGAVARVYVDVQASETASDVIVGDIDVLVADLGLETDEDDADVGGSVQLTVRVDGADGDTLTVGDLSIEVEGTADADEAWLTFSSSGDLVLGDIAISGEGLFLFDGLAHTGTGDLNTSFLAVSAGGDITVGNIDFSGYEGDIVIDLDWVDAGAGSIRAGSGDDTVQGTAGNNIVAGGTGVDSLDISQGGVDTLAFNDGDSGVTEATVDRVIGFNGGSAGAGDKLDFNRVAGTANNYAEGAGAANFAAFVSHAATALNSQVHYFAEVVGSDILVAVSYGTGDPDLIVKLVGVTNLATLGHQNFVA